MPSRPPKVVACPDCTPGKRCDAHSSGLVKWAGARVVCPGCGFATCHPQCPRRIPTDKPIPLIPTDERALSPYYGRRIPSAPPKPFTPEPLPSSAPPPPRGGESGHVYYDVGAVPERMRAWRVLEAAADALLQLREHAEHEGRGTSPTALQRAEEVLLEAARTLRALRKDSAR